MNAIIREWERLLIIRRIPLGEICTVIAVFYADDGLIASRSPETLQTAADLLTGLFCVSLKSNTTKTEVMVFVPGKIRTALSERAYRMRMDEDFHGEGTGRKVECSECGRELAVGSLAGHLAKQHRHLPVVCDGGGGRHATATAIRIVGRNILPGGELLPLPRAGLPARA